MSYTRVAAVTGGNRGIGNAIVRNLALGYPKSLLNNGPLIIYLTARNASKGRVAVDEMRRQPVLREAKVLRMHGGLVDIEFKQLDVADEKSIIAFEESMIKEHADGIDVLVNNAAITSQFGS